MADARTMVDALVRSRRGGLAATAALSGVALIAALAYRAIRGEQAATSDPVSGTPFADRDFSDEEAEIVLRAMVAATVADGQVDGDERQRLDKAVSAAGVDSEGRRWLERQFADPASIDEIAERVATPEIAAQVYAAARLAIDPDTLQERQFLKDLAQALDVSDEAVARLETEITA